MQKSYRLSTFLGVLIIIFVLIIVWGYTPADYYLSNPNCQFSQNAAWISVDWTSQPIDETSVKQLAESADSRNLKYLFPYVSYIKSDGSFSQSYKYSKEFVTTFGKFNKNTRLLGWIGLPILYHSPVGITGWVDLSDQNTRKKIVLFISELVEQSNFDGVHIDAEPVQNNDPYFLNLLDEIRQHIGKDKLISISGGHWQADYWSIFPVFDYFGWTSTYYQKVGQRVEQIAAMTYDSATSQPVGYRLWMREQVKGIRESLSNVDTDLLIGISVSQEKTLTHQPDVENLENGLAGLCAGIASPNDIEGVAIYADWEFSQSDLEIWKTWQK